MANGVEAARSKSVDKNGEAFKKLRVMVLCHEDLVPPDSIDDLTRKKLRRSKLSGTLFLRSRRLATKFAGRRLQQPWGDR
jgi:hypothetical protein